MKMKWRLLDTGARRAAENIALDALLLELRDKRKIQNTFRLLRFKTPTALIGYHQCVEQEIRIDYCKRKKIEINRRLTGGGAIYFDKSQIGFEVIALRRDLGYSLDRITQKIAKGVILGLRRLGIKASFRPRNDIEVDGRKISGTGGTFEGDAFLFQGTLLVDFEVEKMIKALKIPVEKLGSKELNSALERVTWIKRELGYLPKLSDIKEALTEGMRKALNIEFMRQDLSLEEENLLKEKISFYSSSRWIEEIKEPLWKRQIVRTSYKNKGGLIRVALVVDVERKLIRQALITGDFFMEPKRALFDLESQLKDRRFEEIEDLIQRFFRERKISCYYLKEEDFIIPISEAIDKAGYVKLGFSIEEADSINSINGSLINNLQKAEVLLLPYCGKKIDCKYRNREGCSECGECSSGEAFRLARENNLKVITILNYKHLKSTLLKIKKEKIPSYIGCCCQAFFNKRQNIFRNIGIGGVLLDIDDSTCYELNKEEEALRGEFSSQTNIKIKILKRLLELRDNG
jgi:lipoate-protein ligase A